MVAAGVGFLYSCGNSSAGPERVNAVIQHNDGTISLNLEEADRYSDVVNPSFNTAEWEVKVKRAGRYNVWISSATLDTNDLRYKDKVRINVQDEEIAAQPACDKIILDCEEVTFPWFRADSFVGSMYIQDTGLFHVQVVSEQIMPVDRAAGDSSEVELSKLISVYFTPEAKL